MVETISVGDELRELIRTQSWQHLRERLAELDASDVAELVIALPSDSEAFIFRLFGRIFCTLATPKVGDALGNRGYSIAFESMMMVTGPSLTRLTSMCGPNSPV